MGTTVSGEVEVKASPAQVLDLIAAFEDYPSWSNVHKRASIDTVGPDGRPRTATLVTSVMGIVDTQVLEYTWTSDSVSWRLVKASQQKSQDGTYVLQDAGGGKTRVRYEVTVDPLIPLPGFVLKQGLKKIVSAATADLKKHIESLGKV